MNLDIAENLIMLLAAIVGLITCLFHYIETPRKGWLYVTGFFLAHILSDYYWATYTFIMHEDPKVSALTAYLGWNLGYVLLLQLIHHMRAKDSRHFFHPLMLLPIPVNVVQFVLYIPFGGIINNIWQGVFLTLVECFCLQAIIYYFKNRKEGLHFPYSHTLIFFFTLTEYGMWTSSCFDWPDNVRNPYYYFAFANYLTLVFFAWAVGKDYELDGARPFKKSSSEMKFQSILQSVASFIIFGGCVGGYYLALWIRKTMPEAGRSDEVNRIILAILFIISLFVILLILAIIFVIYFRFGTRGREEEQDKDSLRQERAEGKRSRAGIFFIVLGTVALMIFSIVYTSGLFYKVSVNSVYGSGEDMAALFATELENYISDARSTLQLTADTVDLMVQNGESGKEIFNYLTYQTDSQYQQLDENFTGIYAYVGGEYMDGSGWVPPENYIPERRSWYKAAVEAKGKIAIVSPYVDANTGSDVITISKLISAGEGQGIPGSKNVVALDVIVDHIRDITSKADIGGKGYGMILDGDGLIIAHHDPELVGQNIVELSGRDFFNSLKAKGSGTLDTEVDGEDCTLFISPVMDQWYFVFTVSDAELFEDVNIQLTVNIIVSLLIFGMISLFYYLGYKNEQVYGRKMEEMRISRQQREYETRVLLLEKSAADEANKAKSNFLADMSHEIRTPINTILGMNEMILREAVSRNILEYAQNIRVSGKNLLHLINSILDFSKIEGGKMEIVPVRYNIGSMVTYLLNSVSERAREKNLKLFIRVDPGIPSELFGDDTRIGEVMMNLLTNAVKYTMEGSVTLSIREKERKYEKSLIYFEVKDTGIGIRKEDMGRLFESFERLDVVRNKNIEGTGLGMAISTRLLKLMDSELRVESTYGKGSVFFFELWQKIENEAPLGRFEPELNEDEKAHPTGKLLYAPDAHILITDDTKMNITVAVNLLKRTGVRIDTAMSGAEAVARAEQETYDLIFMDQRMPNMDGTETLKAIRALENEKNKNTPVICLTADAISGARERYISEGFTDYLTKPVEGEALERMLREYLPEEKIQKAAEDVSAEEEVSPDNKLYDALRRADVDVKVGLAYCGNSTDTYRMILSEYASDYAEKRENLHCSHSGKDWETYSIFIHSLKSSSKTIGALGLSELAGALEAASEAKDESMLSWDHFRAMRLYEEIVMTIKDNLDVPEGGGGTDDDEEILEFSPSDD
ncbi:MAG: response regulator [Lachnospiraceae bacterium]|nr:response regulator [Lachnospiraceae bacterium]